MKNPLSFLTVAVVHALVVPTLLIGSARAEDDREVLAGMLTAYTGTTTYDSGQLDYYPHTGYRIFHGDGTFYRDVRNHTTSTDETPYRIVLPVGSYFLLAESETQGGVKVPITINAGQWTVVRLDDPLRRGKVPPKVEVIRLPDGSVAGWQFKKRAPRGFLDQLDRGFAGILGGN